MKYTVDNVTLNISDISNDFSGICSFYIPFKHKEFLKDNCSLSKNKRYKKDNREHIFESDREEVYLDNNRYVVDSADLLISYISWCFKLDYNVEINVNYAEPFWAIHDMEHAKNDENFCTVYVDQHIELQRLKDAFEIFLKEGYELTYELVQEVEEAYNSRFGTNVSFEEYLYQEDYEDEYENSDC